MPVLIPNGPDIPAELIRELQEDNVVFFCGAGISRNAGLPTFNGLFSDVYKHLDPTGSADEILASVKQNQSSFDKEFLKLEKRFGKDRLRSVVAEKLNLNPTTLEKHKTLLRLGRLPNDRGIRLVTTNFDNLFELAASELKLKVRLDIAPALPVPLNDNAMSWDTLVHIHGKLGTLSPNQIILTSGDFGRAYLYDQWAATFITRLFDNFTVVFVGYGLNDPILRYVSDAVYASRESSKHQHKKIYILSVDSPELEGVIHIPYKANNDHADLHETLKLLADTKEDPLKSKKGIIETIAKLDPKTATDEQKDNLLWAVYSEIEAKPETLDALISLGKDASLGWLDIFEKHEDASRKAGNKVSSLIDGITCWPANIPQNTPAHYKLWKWLFNYLGEREFTDWIVKNLSRGRVLHPASLYDLKNIINSDDAPPLNYKKLWALCTSNLPFADRRGHNNLIEIDQTFKSNDEALIRMEVIHYLSPKVEFKPTIFRHSTEGLAAYGMDAEEIKKYQTRLSYLVDKEVVLNAHDDAKWLIDKLESYEKRQELLASISFELVNAIQTVVDLWKLFEESEITGDPSVISHPSIVPHPQNHHFREWTHLIDLLWYAHGILEEKDHKIAAKLRNCIRDKDALIFRRLYLALATQSKRVGALPLLSFLTNSNPPNLWRSSLKKEAWEAMKKIWEVGSDGHKEALIDSILTPPKNFMQKIYKNEAGEISARFTFEMLTLLERDENASLPNKAKDELEEIKKQYPKWGVSQGERAYFNSYMESGFGIGRPGIETVPLTMDEIIAKLTVTGDEKDDYDFDLSDQLKNQRGIDIIKLAKSKENISPEKLASVVYNLRQEISNKGEAFDALQELAQCNSAWYSSKQFLYASVEFLSLISKQFPDQVDQNFWKIWDAVADNGHIIIPEFQEGHKSWLDLSLNHPLGSACHLALDHFFKDQRTKGQGLSDFEKEKIEKVCKFVDASHRVARVILASRLNFLYFLAPEWTQEKLVPSFNWHADREEAIAVWQGFAWSPSVTRELWSAISNFFWDNFLPANIEALDKHENPYIQILVFLGIDKYLTEEELAKTAKILRDLDHSERAVALSWLHRRLEYIKREGNPDEYWIKEIAPWIKKVWPQDAACKSSSTTEQFIRMLMDLKESFSVAFNDIKIYLTNTNETHVFIFHNLNENADIISVHPDTTLNLLSITVGELRYGQSYLKAILQKIIAVKPELKHRPEFIRLNEVADKNG